MSVLDFLRRIPLFKSLTVEELEGMRLIFQEREYKKNQVIFMEEETGKYMYIVKYGEVKVVQSTNDGRENILAIHHPGETFGELAMLDNLTSPATVISMQDTKIIAISKQHFESVMMKNPKVIRSLLDILCRKLRESWKSIQILKYTDAETRLRYIFLSLARSDGIPEGDEIVINVKITHQDLAEMAGTSRETISRLISKFQSQSLLRIHAHQFTLVGHPFWRE